VAGATSDVLVALRAGGHVVLRDAVPAERCDAVIDALAGVLGLEFDDPSTWERISPLLDMVPMWGHQSQWEIRQLPKLYEAWATIWGRQDLWVDINSCRVTPPWSAGRADALPIHFDVDPHDTTQRWYPGLVALTDAPAGHGGFRCVPSLFRDHDRWPTSWPPPSDPHAARYPATLGADDEIVEVPLNKGDVLIWDSHLAHGTVRNGGTSPRAVFYLQMHPPGTAADLEERLADVDSGRAPPWLRGKVGHDRLDRHAIALSALGQRLLGSEAWTSP
jgi:hypothetical protein